MPTDDPNHLHLALNFLGLSQSPEISPVAVALPESSSQPWPQHVGEKRRDRRGQTPVGAWRVWEFIGFGLRLQGVGIDGLQGSEFCRQQPKGSSQKARVKTPCPARFYLSTWPQPSVPLLLDAEKI